VAKLVIKISLLCILLVIFSIQGTTKIEQTNQIQPNQRQIKNDELSRNFSLNPDFGKIPLYFIPNKGQVNEKALFYAKASKYTLWLTKEGLVFDSKRRIKRESTKSKRQNPREINNHENYKYDRDVSRLVFVKADRSLEIIPLDSTAHKANYFIGKDKSKWQTNIQTSSAVLYKELYPYIDLKVYGIEQQIEYDFVVKPGGEVSDISFEYKNVEKTRIDEEGNLVISTGFGELKHSKPVCYQVVREERIEITAAFKRIENNIYGFNIEEYNKDYDLIIDPVVLIYSTYFGGSYADEVNDIAVDSDGAVYVTGRTFSSDFPIKNPLKGTKVGITDIFITKINPSGTALVFSTHFGGSQTECGLGMAVDSKGDVYVTGVTQSTDFPTKNPIQDTNTGGNSDAFIIKMNSSGNSLIYSTYLGGSDSECARDIAVNLEGMACVTGETKSADYPTKKPIQSKLAGDEDAFIAKVNSKGSAFIYSTYLGGSLGDGGGSIAVDSEGAAYVTGSTGSRNFPTENPLQKKSAGSNDAFITKINSSGSDFIYSTYLGGSLSDGGNGIAVDSEGAAYVTGSTGSENFPTENPLQKKIAGSRDAFITKINSSGSNFIYSTYLGGSLNDTGNGIAVDSAGVAYLLGKTESSDFPTQNPIQKKNAGHNDVFIAKVSSKGSNLVFSTYLGGSDWDESESIALDTAGAAYITGWTLSSDFPTRNPVQGINSGGEDVFISKIELSDRIRIVSWNILDYPDMNQEPREEYFRSLIDVLNPDILVVQEMASAAGASQFLKEVLNPKKPKLYKAASFFDGPDTDNALFYKKAMFRIVSRQQIPTSFRDITEYKVKIKKGEAKGTTFKVYSVHFSEGAGAKKKRENEALTLRTYLDGLVPDELFLVCGTFNMLSSTEKAFKILTGNEVNNNGRLIDPLNKTGKWHDKSKHKRIHTESTRKAKFGGGADGGLDDRYDMFLISYGMVENEELIYSDGSCCVFGNDGKHLNKAVDKPKNKAVSPEIAEALCQASDHLPVIIDLIPVAKE
jgi:endonuclease/exonuclease/phosphatase family metal-dependent hydrolase